MIVIFEYHLPHVLDMGLQTIAAMPFSVKNIILKDCGSCN